MTIGDTVSVDFAVTDSAGVALDLTGATVKWQLAARPGSAALVTKQTSSGITVTNAAGGLFTVAIASSDTTSLSRGRYYHEAQVTDAAGNISTVAVGHAVALTRQIG